MDIQQMIWEILRECGIPMYTGGSIYTADCIITIISHEIEHKNEKLKICMVYESVAKFREVSFSTIVTTVRSALQKIDFNNDVSKKYFKEPGEKSAFYLFEFARTLREELDNEINNKNNSHE